MKNNSQRKQIFNFILLIAIILFYLLFGCPSRFFFGISCPGCGMSRAFYSILKFDFSHAFYYNAFVFALPFPLLAFLLRKHIGIKPFYFITFIFMIGYVFYYIKRMLQPNDIVYISTNQGAIYKITEFLKEAYNYVKNSNLPT